MISCFKGFVLVHSISRGISGTLCLFTSTKTFMHRVCISISDDTESGFMRGISKQQPYARNNTACHNPQRSKQTRSKKRKPTGRGKELLLNCLQTTSGSVLVLQKALRQQTNKLFFLTNMPRITKIHCM